MEPVHVEPQQLGLAELRPYEVGPGDVLNISLTGLPLATAAPAAAGTAGGPTAGGLHVRVHDDGTIALPMVGDVKIAGLNLAGVERAITAAYVPDYVKTLSVYVELVGSDEPTTVVVRGAAGTPGLVSLKGNQRNLMYALSFAGGFGPGASGRVHVRPIRPDQEEAVYNLGDTNDVRRALVRAPLQSGDIIYVEPESVSAVYVVGLVNVQGAIPIPPGAKLSVVRAIAHAGGLRDFLDPKEGTLLRTLPSGEDVRVKLNVADMIAGVQPDLELQVGDVLTIPHTLDTRVREWAMNNIKIGPFGVGAFWDPITVATFRNNNQNNKVGWGQIVGNAVISNAVGGVLNPAAPKAATVP